MFPSGKAYADGTASVEQLFKQEPCKQAQYVYSVLTLTPYSVQTSVLYVLQVLLPPLKKGRVKSNGQLSLISL